jgi:hypothetical protein
MPICFQTIFLPSLSEDAAPGDIPEAENPLYDGLLAEGRYADLRVMLGGAPDQDEPLPIRAPGIDTGPNAPLYRRPAPPAVAPPRTAPESDTESTAILPTTGAHEPPPSTAEQPGTLPQLPDGGGGTALPRL